MSPPGETSRKTLTDWIESLAGGGPDAAFAWQQFSAALVPKHVELAEAVWGQMNDDERLRLLGVLLYVVGHCALGNWETRNRLFDEAEAMGMHLLPVDYYSPIPNTRELRAHVWETRWDEGPGFNWRVEEQLALLERLGVWAEEMRDTPADKPSLDHRYYYNNGFFDALDAIAYYCIIREFNPRRILEVGAGYSTMLAAQAALRNGTTRLEAIEPFPAEVLRRGFPGLTSLVIGRAQDVPLGEFESLEANDILFIDSTHVSKTDSDVNHLVLRILPRLKPGVLVHVHDIFLPWDYPKLFIFKRKWFFSEQYLVQAFLLFNDAFHVMWGSRYLTHVAEREVHRAFPFAPDLSGSSLWLRRDH